MTDYYFPQPRKEIKTVDQLFDEMEKLNKFKRILEFETNIVKDTVKIVEDWWKLAQEYYELNCVANIAYCLYRYQRLGGQRPVSELSFKPVEINQEQPEPPDFPDGDDPMYRWQTRADMGD
jgi:hypothetical protein